MAAETVGYALVAENTVMIAWAAAIASSVVATVHAPTVKETRIIFVTDAMVQINVPDVAVPINAPNAAV